MSATEPCNCDQAKAYEQALRGLLDAYGQDFTALLIAKGRALAMLEKWKAK